MVVLAAVAVVGFLLWRGADEEGQGMIIPDSTPSSNPRAPAPCYVGRAAVRVTVRDRRE